MIKIFRFFSIKALSAILLAGMALGAFYPKVSIAQTFNSKNRKFLASIDYSSELEKEIRSGKTSTAALIISSRPRLWLLGNWEWNEKDSPGSLAWRIYHNSSAGRSDPSNDQEVREFSYTYRSADQDAFGMDSGTLKQRYLWTAAIAESRARLSLWGLPQQLPDSSEPPGYTEASHTEDQLLADARDKVLYYTDTSQALTYEWPYIRASYSSVAYDWLMNRKFSDGVTPVLTETQKTQIQNGLIRYAEFLRGLIDGSEQLFESSDIAKYVYVMVGLALYEPSGQGISAENNAKAKLYLDEFDKYWVGKILPALNEQGGTGGWHAGLCQAGETFDPYQVNDVLTYQVARILFAHYTATGWPIEKSLYSTGAVKYANEFQTYMVYPDGDYVTIGINNPGDSRYRWIAPFFTSARRRFSSDPEQQWLGELAGWFRNEMAPETYVDAGSYDQFDQMMWEEKWPNPRSATELGCGTRHFAKLGWVCMRSGFASANDLAALFISQRYHWSDLDPFAQNSITLERKGKLIEGYQNTIWIDNQYQRTISGFPTMSVGVQAYAPGSTYDVGPGIQAFRSTDYYDYMYGDATKAYDNSKMQQFSRQVVYVKPDIFIVFDRVVTKDKSYKKSWVIDPGAAPQSAGTNLISITNGSGALWAKRLLPESVVVESQTAQKYQITPSSANQEDVFLHILQAVDSDLTETSAQLVADDAILLTDAGKIGVRVAGWDVLFSTSGDTAVSITGKAVPVELSLFEASLQNEGVQLHWQTASESNNYGFEIERSADNVHFQKVGFVEGHGTTNDIEEFYFLDKAVDADTRYYYRLKQLTTDGSVEYSQAIVVFVEAPVSFDLFANYPNPFNPSTTIRYDLAAAGFVTLSVYDALGHLVKILAKENQAHGRQQVSWDGRDNKGDNVPSGLYFAKLSLNKTNVRTVKMLLIR